MVQHFGFLKYMVVLCLVQRWHYCDIVVGNCFMGKCTQFRSYFMIEFL
jgi:hypothetical protein